jgi:hypothetical protein
MADHPILFSAPMVLALLAGTKTQTRRVAKRMDCLCGHPVADHSVSCGYTKLGACGKFTPINACPYGHPGDRLWVRETWVPTFNRVHGVLYAADHEFMAYEQARPLWPCRTNWRPSIFMPRWASRILLEITEVRVQRVQEISGWDAIQEGCGIELNDDLDKTIGQRAQQEYTRLWDSINGKRPGCAWVDNPWTWAISFRRIANA